MGETREQSPDTTQSGHEADFRVVVFSRGNDPERLAETLQDALQLNRIDARIQAAHIPGVLPDRLDRDQAGKVVEAIRKTGISAAVVSRPDIPCLDHPVVVHHAACSQKGLEIFDVCGVRTELVKWPDLDFVSVGHVPMEAAHHSRSESLVVIHSAPHIVDEESEGIAVHGPVCWLIARDPQRVYFVNHSQMNYDYLESRKTASATANFHEFLQDLIHFGKDAFLTPSTHAILERRSANDYTFRDADQFRQNTLVQYLLHRVIDAEHLPDHD